jgi:hypothetical protein
VSKLYYRAARPETVAAFAVAFGEIAIEVDGHKRRGSGWPSWVITTTVDTSPYW